MGVMSSLRALLGRGRSVSYAVGGSALGPCDPAHVYRTQPTVQAVVDFLANNVAELPLKFYRRMPDGGRERVRDSVAARLFERPNPDQTCFELLHDLMADTLVFGEGVLLVVPDADAPSGWQMRHVPTAWCRWLPDGTAFSRGTLAVNSGGGQEATFPAGSYVLFRAYSPDGATDSVSPIEVLWRVVSEQREADEFRRQAWARGGRMNAYITRPKELQRWTEEQRARFTESFKEAWTGRNGSQVGGVPVLEDGMEIHPFTFSAHEAQWAESKKFAREDVAAVYHVNPSLIWHSGTQTYASAKDNARSFYADTMAPYLRHASDRINGMVLPMVGEDPNVYAEFDLQAKLAGSFEEQARVIQSSVGGPWMSRAEARERFNLPHIDGTDGLIVPLNVLEGGLASPRDTAPKAAPDVATHDATRDGCACCKAAPDEVRVKAHPTDESFADFVNVYAKFFRRQRRAVLSAMGASKAAKADGDPDWWDAERWDRELAEDLVEVVTALSTEQAREVMRALGLDPDEYSPEKAVAYLMKVCESRAIDANGKTLDELLAAVAAGGEPSEVFDAAENERSVTAGRALACAVAGWSALESVRQARDGGRDVSTATKTWRVTSANPRASHARMDGETVPYDARFSNGAKWPGDTGALGADEVCGCQCEVEITVKRGGR